MTRDLLIEIGTEELPPKALNTLSEAFTQGIEAGLTKAQLAFGTVRRYATPRRLAVQIDEVACQQPDRTSERRGPALQAAYDNQGQPTPAALGFARSCGVEMSALTVQKTDKGEWLVYESREAGAATVDLIPTIVRNALVELPIPKRMRWADRDDEFVRPVQWIVLLFGTEVIPATLFGLQADRITRGHRFHHPEPIEIAEPRQYADLLEHTGYVMADFYQRRERVSHQAMAAARQVNGQAVIQPDLLDEVTALVEWPVAILGHFEPRFLDVPAEALMTTMQDNQKYFPIMDGHHRLLPHFIATANLESRDPEQVRIGNERVIRPRFSDAEFFWKQDRKQPLSERLEPLKHVIFQQQLGNLHDKSERVAALARWIAQHIGSSPEWAERAGRLCKCDLLTQMVQEFPELQGIMGRYYALQDGEATEVAVAIEEHYRPRFAGDELPLTATGQAVALADRIDTLIGIFAIGQAPSGAKDPFALRRAALGVLRIVIEKALDLDFIKLLQFAAGHFDPVVQAPTHVNAVFDFVMERLRAYYLDQGVRPDTFEAVLECRPTRPLDFDRRLRAVDTFRGLPEAESLTQANRRIRNLLKKVEGNGPTQVQFDQLQLPEEQALADCLDDLTERVVPLLDQGHYNEALRELAALREPVDRFFDTVRVMVDDEKLRNNRLALLNQLGGLFLRVADFSRLQEG